MHLGTVAKNAEANATAALCNAGKLRIYAGTPPASAIAALSGNTLLAELTFGSPAFGAASSGVVTANAITADSSCDATGTPTFARAFQADGTTVVFQVTASATGGGGELQLSGLVGGQIIAGGICSATSLSYSRP